MSLIYLLVFIGLCESDCNCSRLRIENQNLQREVNVLRRYKESKERWMQEDIDRTIRVNEINAEYYRRTGKKPVPYWDMP